MTETAQDVTPQRAIAGFWRRLFALVIDGICLGVAGLLLGWLCFDVFARMGEAARLVGLAIAWPYLGVLNSRIGGGRTIGKWWLGLRVVGRDGAPIGLTDSLVRAITLLAPLLLSGIQLPDTGAAMAWEWVLSIVVLGGLATIAYLHVFNRRTRQSLHDLAVGSYVVRDGADTQHLPSIWKGHLWVAAALFVLAGSTPMATPWLLRQVPLDDMRGAQRAVSSLPLVHSATVERGFTAVAGGNRTDWVRVTARLKTQSLGDAALAKRIAQIVAQQYPDSRRQDAIGVTLVYGYDIGIASGWLTRSYRFSPGELAGDRSEPSLLPEASPRSR